MSFRKILKDSLTLSMATLMSLSLCSPAVANAKAVNHSHQRFSRKSYSYKQLIKKAKKDSKYDSIYCTYDSKFFDKPLRWYSTHRKLWSYSTYRKAYLHNIYKLNKHNSKNLKNDLKFINKYMQMHGAFKRGYLDASSANYINKRNSRNPSYAKGYIKGYNDSNGYGVYFCYQEYRNLGGKIPYTKLNLSLNHKKAYQLGFHLAKSAYFNAWSSRKIDKEYNKAKLGKKYLYDFYMGRFNYTNNNNNSQFAKNVRPKYRFQKTLYFPSYIYGNGFISGVALSRYNNKAVRQTVKNLNNYVNNFYGNASSIKPSEKQRTFQNNFKQNYNIKPIYNHAYFQYGGTNKYYVYHRDVKKSGVTYMMPDGQHIGMHLSDKD